MNRKTASSELRELFAEELRNDPNATLVIALQHVRDLYDRGPDEPAGGELSNRVVEIEELIAKYDEHTPLSDFVPTPTDG